jgi:hypothetical protein
VQLFPGNLVRLVVGGLRRTLVTSIAICHARTVGVVGKLANGACKDNAVALGA